MKYPSQTLNNNAHVVVGILPKAAVGTIRARAYKLRPGGLAPLALTISAANDVAVDAAVPGINAWAFDVRHAMEQTAAGSFATAFPQWEEHGCLVVLYDDADAESWDAAKITFGGGEDQIDEIRGADRRNLTEIFDAITGANVYSCLTGYNYIDSGAQATDTLQFAPFLLKGDQQVNDRFLRSAVVSVYAVDGAAPLFTINDLALETSLTGSVTAGDAILPVADSSGFAVNDVVALENELVEVLAVPNGTSLQVARGHLGTTAAAHGSGVDVVRSAADGRGIFHVQKVDTSSMTVGNQYTVKITIGYQDRTYTSTHQFTFVMNDV